MKVLHITTQLEGGAGRSVQRLCLALKAQDVEAAPLALVNQSSGILRRPLSVLARWKIGAEQAHIRRRALDTSEMFSSDQALVDVAHHPGIREADVIHLHWVVGMIDYVHFFSHAGDRPIVWTLHDMNPFTGGCHYSAGCQRYIEGCGACPQLRRRQAHDVSFAIAHRKREALLRVPHLHLVAPSQWIADAVQRSAVMGHLPVSVIPNTVPTEAFVPADKARAKRICGLVEESFVILFVADYDTPRKGFGCLKEAIERLVRLEGGSRVCLMTLGRVDRSLIKDIPCQVKEMGFKESDYDVARCYDAADVVAVPSVEDNYPNVALEAMACGRPVVASAVGGLKEMIVDGHNGFLVPPGDAGALAEKLSRCLHNAVLCQTMGEAARHHVTACNAPDVCAQTYAALYDQLIRQNH